MKPCSWSDNFTKAISRGDKAVGHVLRGLNGDYRVLVDDKQVSVKKRHFDAFFESEGQTQMAECAFTIQADTATARAIVNRQKAFYALPWYKRLYRVLWLRDPFKLPTSMFINITK